MHKEKDHELAFGIEKRDPTEQLRGAQETSSSLEELALRFPADSVFAGSFRLLHGSKL